MLGSAKRNITKIILCTLLVTGLSIGGHFIYSFISNPTAYAQPSGGSVTDPPKDDDKTDDDETTCAIDKIGWFLCPIIEKAGVVGDQAFQLLSKNFLETEPELVARFNGKGGDSGTYIAWGLARNIANIMFIAAFLIIILSQVTGRGLDNYGIKKILPRLIIAAIAVNISYYICQLLVDLTNVLGYEIENFMVKTAAQVTHSVVLPVNTGFSSTQTDNGALGTLAGGIIAGAAIVWFLLPVLFLGVSTVVITCLVIIAILLMRKAFIVLLIVVSPIAFVLYLLPNTEKYFRKWASMFWQLLLVFPTVSLLFGGGQLASAIVLVAGSNGGTDVQNSQQKLQPGSAADQGAAYKDSGNKCIQLATVNNDGEVVNNKAEIKTCGDKSTPFMLGLVAAGIAVAPMLAVWAVLKGALSAAGAIGGKIGGAIQTAGNKGDAYGKKAEKAVGQTIGTAAYKSKYTRPIMGAGRRFKLRAENRESAFKAAQAGYDATDGFDLTKQKFANNYAAAAAEEGAKKQYIDEVNEGKVNVGKALGSMRGEDSIAEALATQQKRASDEVIKAIKEGFQSTDIEDRKDANGNVISQGIRSAFRDAVNSGNIATAKAMQDMLMSSGAAGRKAFREEYGGTGIASGSTMDTALRQNIQSNNPGAKDKDAALKQWADKGGQKYTDLWDHGDWSNVDSVQKFAALDGAAQVQAARNMAPARLAEIKAGLAKNPAARDNLDLGLRAQWNL